MASDLDKFVLQYTVELKDSIQKLEKLNQKVEKVNKEAKGAKAQMGDFAKGATSELGKLVPGVKAVSTAVAGMGAAFTVAGVAVAALAAGVAAVIKLRDQYNQQTAIGKEIGTSGLRVESYQRQLVENGGGLVSREVAAEGLKSISDKVSAAYTDPSRLGTEAKIFKLMGIDVGAPGKGRRSTNDIMRDIGAKFSSVSEEKAQGYGKALGLTQDFVKSLRKSGAAISQSSLTQEEVESRKKAQKNLDEFNDAVAQLTEQFTRLSNALAEYLLPAVTKVVSFFGGIGRDRTPEEKEKSEREKAQSEIAKRRGDELGKLGWFDRIKQNYQEARRRAALTPEQRKAEDEERERKYNSDVEAQVKANKEAAEKNKAAATQMMDTEDKSQKNIKTAQDQFQLAINMFNGAVTAFSNAVDERQAIAAWAGELGKATGLAPSQAVGPGESRLKIQQQQVYNNIAAGLGVDPAQLRNGGVNRGDVTWQANQMEAGIQNKIFSLQRQAQTVGLPATEYQRIKRETYEQQMGLNALRANRGMVEAGSREGGRSITVGAIPISVVFGGRPNANVNEVKSAVQQGVQDGIAATQNMASSGNKY